jgi:hypothetical protein
MNKSKFNSLCMSIAMILLSAPGLAQTPPDDAGPVLEPELPSAKAHYQGQKNVGISLGIHFFDGSAAYAIGGRAGYYILDDLMLGIDATYLLTPEDNVDDFLIVEPLAKYLLINHENFVFSATGKIGRYQNMGNGESGFSAGAGPGFEIYWGKSGYFAGSFLVKKIFIDDESLTSYEIGAGLGF